MSRSRDPYHVHQMDEISRTTEGELGILLACSCGKVATEWPSRKKKSKYVA